MSGRLAGKRALVVGGGSGIGRAVVDAFAAEGAAVGVLERSPQKAADLERAGVDVTAGDSTVALDCAAAVAATVRAFGGLDVLVNCVGVFDYRTPLRDIDRLEDAFDEIMRTNVLSQLVSVQAALERLRATKGAVVLTGSTSSFMGGRGGVLYVASKFAVRGVVSQLAHELAPDVRVNGVAPGGTIATDLRGLAALGQDGRSLGALADREADVRRRSPLGTALTPADVAASYVFLASDESRGTTGRFLHPDGGANLT